MVRGVVGTAAIVRPTSGIVPGLLCGAIVRDTAATGAIDRATIDRQAPFTGPAMPDPGVVPLPAARELLQAIGPDITRAIARETTRAIAREIIQAIDREMEVVPRFNQFCPVPSPQDQVHLVRKTGQGAINPLRDRELGHRPNRDRHSQTIRRVLRGGMRGDLASLDRSKDISLDLATDTTSQRHNGSLVDGRFMT